MIEKDTARQTGTPMRYSRRDTGLIILLLLLILALAALLRFYSLGSQSLWSDEGNSAALATRSLVQIAQDAAHDIHPPLYYWLLRLWTIVFGLSEFALRSLSALLGTLLVLTIYGLGARLFNRTTGLAAAFIAAIAPLQVYYSQEARMYILVALEGATAALLFWWFVGQEDARLPVDGSPSPTTPAKHAGMRLLSFSGLLLTLVWVAGLYTHYAFPLMIGLLSLLYLAWLIVTRSRGLLGWRILRWGLLLILTLVLYGPWLATAIQQLLTWPRVAVQPDLWTQMRTLLATLTLGPVAKDVAGHWWAWLLPALALLGALPWPLTNRHGTGGSNRLDWLRFTTPIAWVVAPVAMIAMFGLFREAYLKFLLIASPAFSLLLARAVMGPTERLLRTPPAPVAESAEATSKPSRAWWRGVAGVAWTISTLAVIGALSGAALARYYSDPALARDDYRSIAQFVVATAHPNDAIVLIAPGQAEVFNYYYDGDLPVYALPQQRPLDLQATLAEFDKLMQHDKIYVVYWASRGGGSRRGSSPIGWIPADIRRWINGTATCAWRCTSCPSTARRRRSLMISTCASATRSS